ncbi:MerR family transcriptional regulator [Nocardia sp. NPDC058666]|uniref:MerR family transcriptional regulator n=1 Tax=Nocardia sp. NPDC058666 TaxID=3346587 RepID=UPI00365D6C11
MSERSGIAVATIKYYLREGLLPPGERTSPNQASYGEEHLRRLRLIRALIEVGGIPVATVADVLDAIDSPETPLFRVLGVAQDSVSPPVPAVHDAEWDRAHQTVCAEMDRRGWSRHHSLEAVDNLASVLVRLAQLGYRDWATTAMPTYFDGARVIAENDVAAALSAGDRDDIVDAVVVLTVLGDTALAIIRRIAQAQASMDRLKPTS